MILSLAVLLASLLLVAMAARMERGRDTRPGSSPLLLLLLLLGLGLGLLCHLSPLGDMATGDGPYHMGRIFLYRDVLQAGEWPIWSNRWYCGFPLDMYYGFAFYPLPAALSLVSGATVFSAAKIILWMLGIVSGVGMFLAARAILGNAPAALVAAAGYAFSLQHVGTVLDSGALPAAGVFAVFPFLFLAWERRRPGAGGPLPAGIIAGALLSLLVFFHVQFGALAAAGFFLFLLGGLFRAGAGSARDRWAFPLAAGLSFFAFSAWFLLPFPWETRDLLLGAEKAGTYFFDPRRAGEALREAGEHLFAWRDKYESFSWHFHYLGNTLLALGAAGAVSSLGRRGGKRPFAPFLAVFLLGAGWIVLCPRFASIWLFFLCLAAAQGALVIGERARELLPRAGMLAAPALLALVLVDIAPRLDYVPYRDAGPSYPGGAPDALAGTPFATAAGRYSVITRAGSTLWRIFDTVRPGLSSPFGTVPQSAARSYLYAAAAHHRAQEEYLRDGRISPAAAGALRLLGESFLLVPWRGELVSLPHPSLALFAPEVVEAPRAGPLEAMDWHTVEGNGARGTLDFTFLDQVVRESQLDPDGPRAWALVLPAGEVVPPPFPIDALPAFTVASVRETPTTVRVEFEAESDGYLQLAYSWWRWNRAFLDGREVPTRATALHLTMVEVPAGRHAVELRAGLSPFRKGLLFLALAAVCPGIWLAGGKAGRSRLSLFRNSRIIPRADRGADGETGEGKGG